MSEGREVVAAVTRERKEVETRATEGQVDERTATDRAAKARRTTRAAKMGGDGGEGEGRASEKRTSRQLKETRRGSSGVKATTAKTRGQRWFEEAAQGWHRSGSARKMWREVEERWPMTGL